MTSDIPLHHPFRTFTDPEGRAVYVNSLARHSQWMHPGILGRLQDAGHVPPDAWPASAVDKSVADSQADDAPPLPDGWEEVRVKSSSNSRGAAPYYVDHNTQTTTWEHPTLLVKGETEGKGLPFRDLDKTERERDEEVYTARGEMPPWVVEERTKGEESGEGKMYWVDYRTGKINMSQSPLDTYAARESLRRMMEGEGEEVVVVVGEKMVEEK